MYAARAPTEQLQHLLAISWNRSCAPAAIQGREHIFEAILVSQARQKYCRRSNEMSGNLASERVPGGRSTDHESAA